MFLRRDRMMTTTFSSRTPARTRTRSQGPCRRPWSRAGGPCGRFISTATRQRTPRQFLSACMVVGATGGCSPRSACSHADSGTKQCCPTYPAMASPRAAPTVHLRHMGYLRLRADRRRKPAFGPARDRAGRVDGRDARLRQSRRSCAVIHSAEGESCQPAMAAKALRRRLDPTRRAQLTSLHDRDLTKIQVHVQSDRSPDHRHLVLLAHSSTERENHGRTTQTDTCSKHTRASRRGGHRECTGSKPIVQNGLPNCVLPESPCPGHRTVAPDPDEPSKTHFHAPRPARDRAARGGCRGRSSPVAPPPDSGPPYRRCSDRNRSA
jgi:hypothetical protein